MSDEALALYRLRDALRAGGRRKSRLELQRREVPESLLTAIERARAAFAVYKATGLLTDAQAAAEAVQREIEATWRPRLGAPRRKGAKPTA